MITATQNKNVYHPQVQADFLRAHHLNMTYGEFVRRRDELHRQLEILRRDKATWTIPRATTEMSHDKHIDLR